MSQPCGPPWARLYPRGHNASQANPGLRVSDAERAEVADRLSKHYSDGRLDQAEFNERLEAAMKAKTRSELSGLFDDLPAAEQPKDPERPRPRHALPRLLFLVLVIVIAAGAGQALMHSFIPWLLIGLLVFLWLRHGPRSQRRQ